MSKLEKLLNLARVTALTHGLISGNRCFNRHGAILFYSYNQIITKQTNNKERCFGAGSSQHAEISCILRSITRRRSKRNCIYQLNNRKGVPKRRRGKLKMLICRINSEGKIVGSKPCYHCIQQMRKIGIYQIYYTNDEGNLVAERVSNITNSHVCNSERLINSEIKAKPWLRTGICI